jgi:hypothetical protein
MTELHSKPGELPRRPESPKRLTAQKSFAIPVEVRFEGVTFYTKQYLKAKKDYTYFLVFSQ